MSFWVSINGVLAPAEKARISVLDNGFTLGDGVYETLRTYGGRPFRLDLHLARLRASALRVGIEVPTPDAEIGRWLDATLEAVGERECYVRTIVTRGVGDVTYHFDRVQGPTIAILARPFEPLPAEHYERGIAATVVSVRRNPREAADPAIKSCSLLNSVLAVREAQGRGCVEGIMLNTRGEVAEGASSNVFAFRDGALCTPPLDAGILAGITRQLVMEIARESGIVVREAPLSESALRTAEEAFITSSVREVVPIATLDGRPLGDGRPGPVTRQLLLAFRAYAAHQGG
jgi:branched-chain amino acid aminotransferase